MVSQSRPISLTVQRNYDSFHKQMASSIASASGSDVCLLSDRSFGFTGPKDQPLFFMSHPKLSGLRKNTVNHEIVLSLPLPNNFSKPADGGFSWSCYITKVGQTSTFDVRRISLGYRDGNLLLEGDSQVIFACFANTARFAKGTKEQRQSLCQMYGIPDITTGLREVPTSKPKRSSRLVSFSASWLVERVEPTKAT